MMWSALPQFILLYCLSVCTTIFQSHSNPHSLSRSHPPSPPLKLALKCRTIGAKGALRQICLKHRRVKQWVFTLCVYTQNTKFFQENPMMDQNQFGPNINTTPVQSYVRDRPYPSG